MLNGLHLYQDLNFLVSSPLQLPTPNFTLDIIDKTITVVDVNDIGVKFIEKCTYEQEKDIKPLKENKQVQNSEILHQNLYTINKNTNNILKFDNLLPFLKDLQDKDKLIDQTDDVYAIYM